MKRSIRFAPLALVALLGSSAHALDLPNLDKALEAPAASSQVTSSRQYRGAVASWDAQRGVPTFFRADPTAPRLGSGLAATPDAEQIARAYVRDNATLYGLSSAAQEAAYVRLVHDTGRGGIIVVLGQRVSGVEVFETEMKVLMSRTGQLVAIGGNLHAAAAPKSKGAAAAFAKGPASAIAIAVEDAFDVPVTAADLVDLKKEKAGYRSFGVAATAVVQQRKLVFTTPARAKKVFYAMPERLVPAYYLEVDAGRAGQATSDLYGYVIAAGSGEILMRRHLVQNDTFNYRVWADTTAPYTPYGGPQEDFAPHPTGVPDGSYPDFVTPNLITMEAFNTNPDGKVDPWLPATGTVTTGNNVDAYADLAAPDGFSNGDVRATTTATKEFDRVYDTTQGPAASQGQIMASATQLFYVTNWLHDYMYDSGFNEKAGNAQASNLGRGGVEGDVMLAEAQDYSGTDNANMSTPADGQSPRMQMYVWSPPSGATSTLNIQPGNLTYAHQDAGFGPVSFNTMAALILAVDGAGADPNDACENITNNVTGKIALINRGTCTFEAKVLAAQQAGAVGVLIANNQNNGLPGMGDDATLNGVNIGSFGITQANGNTLKTMLMNGVVTVTMVRAGTAGPDGSIDNDIVAHEWGHYIHHRLVSCGSDQCGAQSEGWGDFNAMLMKLRDGDNVATGVFAMSTYATVAFNEAGYFGIRRFPYSRDTAKNGLTFKHISNGVAMPPGPQNPINVPNFESHNAGEVWTTMMYEAYTNLIMNGGHPFAETQRRMADYMVAGMIMAPANPTFTEQRDGVLAAAFAADPADFTLLAQGFAKRGAGTCAVSPPRSSTTGSGVVEDFNVSGQHELAGLTLDDSIKSCDGDGVLDAQEVGKLHILVRNAGGIALTGTTAKVTAANPEVSFPNGNSVMVPTVGPYQTAEVTVDVTLSAAVTGLTGVDFTVDLDNAAACKVTTTDTTKLFVHYDDKAKDSATETFDSDKTPWTLWGAPGYESLADQVWTRQLEMNGNHRYYGQNFPAHSDTALTSPDIVVGGGNLVVTFKHRHDFESSPLNPGEPDTRWDGGLMEISQDGGASWQDVSMYSMPGYNGTIANEPGADNPLGDRPGFVGRNPAWPNTNNVTLDFGGAFANKTVRIRFRIGTDAAAGVPDFEGWYVDDIAVEGANKPFNTVTGDGADCDLVPSADAGPDLVLDEGTMGTLDASGSSDPGGQALTYSWMQLVGPAATLSDAAAAKPVLTAPLVGADTPLTFEVTVSNGGQIAKDTVNVLVKDVPSSTGGTGGTGGSMSTGGSATGGSAAGGDGGSGGSGGSGGGELDLDDSGCGCRTAGDGPRGGAAAVSALGLLALLMRRRRRSAK